MNRSSSQRRVSMRRPRSSGMTLSVLVRTSLIMKTIVPRRGIISGVRPARPPPRAAEQPDRPLDPAASLRPGDVPEPFFDRLDAILGEIHARGVAHGDLHRHDVLLGPGGDPCLVDFSTAVVARTGAPALTRCLFRQMCHADLRSAAKRRRRLLPGSRAPVPDRRGLYRIGGWIKRSVGLLRRPRRRAGGRTPDIIPRRGTIVFMIKDV